MKQKYFIGDLEFKTKKECENYTRNIINNLGCCKIDKNHKDFSFFNDLLQNHPSCDEKKGVGVDYFYIQPNTIKKGSYQTMIKRLDNTNVDFSWVYCCQFKERTTNDDLLRAMREAIKMHTINYKKQNELICQICGNKNESYENYHVDHNNPSFQTLKDEFLKLTKKELPTSFTECKISKLTIFNDDDKDFENEWLDYHNKNCNLQILCATCNLTKKKD